MVVRLAWRVWDGCLTNADGRTGGQATYSLTSRIRVSTSEMVRKTRA